MKRAPSASLLLCSLALCFAFAGCSGDDDEARLPRGLPGIGGARRAVSEDSLYGATAIENLRVTPVELDAVGLPPAFDGMRIAALANPQLGLWPQNEQLATLAARQAAALNPDVIVLLGDYVARGGRDQYAALGRVLAPLRGRRVAAVLSERDIRNDTAEYRITRALSEAGVVLLRNERFRLIRGQDTVRLLGIDPKLYEETPWEQGEILKTLPRGFTVPVLLAALPQTAVRLPANRYSVVLAGDTFCGEVDVPGATRLGVMEAELLAPFRLPETPRLYNVRGNILFLPCALGYSFVPARLGAAPEVAVITLRALEPPSAADTARVGALNVDSVVSAFELRSDSVQRRRAARARRDSLQAARDSAR